MNNRSISELYKMGEISGFAYLACVENDIHTLADAIEKDIFNYPKYAWSKELVPFIETNDEAASQSIENSPFQIEIAEDIYKKLFSSLDVRSATALKIAESKVPSFTLFLKKLLTRNWEFWQALRKQRSVGSTTIQRIQVFADLIIYNLGEEGISVESLFGVEPSVSRIDGEQHVDNEQLFVDRVSETRLREIVHEELAELSVRSHNALKVILQECNDSYCLFYQTITDKGFDVKQIRNVGRKIVPEIKAFIKRVTERFVNVPKLPGYEGNDLPEESDHVDPTSIVSEDSLDLEHFRPFFEAKMHELSVRSYHAILALFQKCGESVGKFIDTVSRSDFRISSLPAIGRKSANEISLWIASVRSSILSQDRDLISLEHGIRASQLAKRGLKGNVERINQINDALDHFALFTSIDEYIKQLDERDRLIVDSQLKIYQNQVLQNRKESAKDLRISPERLRQLRITIFGRIKKYISGLRQFVVDNAKYRYSFKDINLINSQEGTSFNENFILWTLSLVWPQEYVLYDDVDVAFANPYGYEKNLVILPRALYSIFDFDVFGKYFEALKEEKRVDDSIMSIRETIIRFFRGRIYYEDIDSIEEVCRTILSKSIGLEVRHDSVIIERNSIRSNPEWVELIIREVGHPLTIEEIYNELERRHPGKTKSAFALAGAVRTNPNITPIGRSSTFGLKEWTKGDKRGGTIREFATEYLLTLPMPIATIEDIGQYVRQYRPTSSDKSIHANLLLEANGAFALFYDSENHRYIGLPNYDYMGQYRKYDPLSDSKRDFKTSCTLLEEFVAKNGRLPFTSSEDEEEMRLCRFWGVQLGKLQGGQLEGEELEIVKSMKERFEKFRINKRDYEWQQTYKAVFKALKDKPSISSLTKAQLNWISNQYKVFISGRMPESRIPRMKELLELVQEHAN